MLKKRGIYNGFYLPRKGNTTSRFGKDFLNGIARVHNRIDIAQIGVNEVVSSTSGKVSESYLSSSYGEWVRVFHEIKGQTWETLYAHMRIGSRKVRVGEYVKQGQPIGIMGNTGYSFGQHLHFELHKGRWILVSIVHFQFPHDRWELITFCKIIHNILIYPKVA
jgi:murein DD-endopeptidase MepM/ murein hydrolase activator NlpD